MADTFAKSNRKLLIALIAACVLMFGFAFALVPLYNVFCQVTGLNGKTSNTSFAASDFTIDPNRWVTIELVAVNNEELPWEFKPIKHKVKIHPGEVVRTAYFAQNKTENPMVVQAIPSVSPGVAASHLKKIECFCFQRQALDGHAGQTMPLIFTVDADLPTNVKTLSLSYTLFDVTERSGVVDTVHSKTF